MGTPDFAKNSLERLYEDGHEVVGVFTQPDRPRSRGMKVSHSPVKELAVACDTPVFQPDSLKGGTAADDLRRLNCDLVVAVAYGKLLPADILEVPPLGCINIHASLLPKYRGAAPIQWAILNGEEVTGVTAMYLTEEMDTGDILLAKQTSIGADETSGALFGRLAILGAELLSETVSLIANGRAQRTPQNHDEATYAPMLGREMSPIDWTGTALSIGCKVRGLNPWPTATAELRGMLFKVFAVETIEGETSRNPGEIVSTGNSGIEVACADGSVIIKELQAPGGKRMAAADYLRGNSF